MLDRPLFLENEEWYERSAAEHDSDMFTEDIYGNKFDEPRRWRLTDKAPQEAIDSYEEFYNPVMYDENGNSLVPDGWSAAF